MSKPRKCLGGCGRWLTSPESIALGYGRHCAEVHGVKPARRPARLRRPVVRPVDAPPAIHPGQSALELIDHQPAVTPTADRPSEEQ